MHAWFIHCKTYNMHLMRGFLISCRIQGNPQYVIYTGCEQAWCATVFIKQHWKNANGYDLEHMNLSELHTSTTNIPVSASEY